MDFDTILAAMALEDGALIEIYVFDTTADDWRRVVDRLAAEGRIESFTLSGEEMPPESVNLFQEEPSLAMSVRVGSGLWTTSFHDPTEIDLQGDPREVRDHTDLERIRDFMRQLHKITGRRVVLVTETLSPRETTPYLTVAE
jgi:hypothetical protein